MTTPIALPESLTLHDAPAALAVLRRAFEAEPGPAWHLDATPLRQLDTSALAVLLECRRLAEARQRSLSIAGAPGRLVDLARLYGVAELIGVA